ncbi:SPJ_0845 family protein [Enterococcus bulliens]
MGLKFQRDDALDKRLEDFAFLPPEEEKEAIDISRFLLPEDDEDDEEKKQKRSTRIRALLFMVEPSQLQLQPRLLLFLVLSPKKTR